MYFCFLRWRDTKSLARDKKLCKGLKVPLVFLPEQPLRLRGLEITAKAQKFAHPDPESVVRHQNDAETVVP